MRDIINDEISIFKIFLNNSIFKFMKFFLIKIYKKMTTPIQVEIDVAIGIIKKPICAFFSAFIFKLFL